MQCIFCGADKSLNTSMDIKIDDDSPAVKVMICDVHAEEATIKSVKEAYLVKQRQIEEVLAQAKALGLNVGETATGITTIHAAAKPPPLPVDRRPTPAIEYDESDPNVVPTSLVDGKAGIRSVGGATDLGTVESHTSHTTTDLKSALPEGTRDGRVRMGLVEGRGGQPMAIQRRRTDGTGTTRINVIQTESDASLQKRFKEMAKASEESGVTFSKGYAQPGGVRDCPICRGECVVMQEGVEQECPKCDGTGIITV